MSRLRKKRASAGAAASARKLTAAQARNAEIRVLRADVEHMTFNVKELEQAITLCMGALRDLLVLWDRKDDHGWTAADVNRLAEIRKLVNP